MNMSTDGDSKGTYTIGSKMIHMGQNRYNLDLEIMLLLAREELHVRAIARSLRESHSTIMRRLNNLVGENVLGYKKNGRNKTFFIKRSLQARSYLYNAERYKQIKLLKQYPHLTVIAEEVLKKCVERMIVIFGSHAKFIAKKDSDVDIYVETRDKKVKDDIELVHSKINVKIGEFHLNSQLIREIVRNHVILRGVEEFYEKTGFFE